MVGLGDALLMFACYAYILSMIFLSSKIGSFLPMSRKASRKFLHAMIGNLPFVIPFFSSSIYPVLVAAPFILVTFAVSPYSPYVNSLSRLRGLAEITEGGHRLGLILYAVSYTVLALFFASRPYVIAAGILPMAYGDSLASIVGERWGRTRYRLPADKSLEGSMAMFLGSLLSLLIGVAFFSQVTALSLVDGVLPALGAAAAATLVEAFTPLGFDNLTVPASGAIAFLALYRSA
jgi:dolichol kinase